MINYKYISVLLNTFDNVSFIRSLQYLVGSVARNFLDSVVTLVFTKKLPKPTERESELCSELKYKFSKLPKYEELNVVGLELTWNTNLNRLIELVKNKDCREFLRWDVIRMNMFSSNAPYILKEFNYLKQTSDWEGRWRDYILEDNVGRPAPYLFYRKSSGSLIHHAYHLAKFEEQIDKNICDFDLVFEFGPGYGGLCRLIFRMANKPIRYICYDLKPFSYLQEYFLKMVGVPVINVDEFINGEFGVVCVSEYKEIEMIFDSSQNDENKLFVASWSLSEAEDEIKNYIENNTRNYDAYLIGWSQYLNEQNNIDFFNKFKANRRNLEWVDIKINHLANGNRYLMGHKL